MPEWMPPEIASKLDAVVVAVLSFGTWLAQRFLARPKAEATAKYSVQVEELHAALVIRDEKSGCSAREEIGAIFHWMSTHGPDGERRSQIRVFHEQLMAQLGAALESTAAVQRAQVENEARQIALLEQMVKQLAPPDTPVPRRRSGVKE